jgi:hypothetical protein
VAASQLSQNKEDCEFDRSLSNVISSFAAPLQLFSLTYAPGQADIMHFSSLKQ